MALCVALATDPATRPSWSNLSRAKRRPTCSIRICRQPPRLRYTHRHRCNNNRIHHLHHMITPSLIVHCFLLCLSLRKIFPRYRLALIRYLRLLESHLTSPLHYRHFPTEVVNNGLNIQVSLPHIDIYHAIFLFIEYVLT